LVDVLSDHFGIFDDFIHHFGGFATSIDGGESVTVAIDGVSAEFLVDVECATHFR